MVRHYWKLKGEPKRTIFISRWNAYHGSTVAGVSLGGMKAMHAQGDLPIPGVEHVRQPYAYGEGQGMSVEEFCDACVKAIEDKILEVGPQNCAARSEQRRVGQEGGRTCRCRWSPDNKKK